MGGSVSQFGISPVRQSVTAAIAAMSSASPCAIKTTSIGHVPPRPSDRQATSADGWQLLFGRGRQLVHLLGGPAHLLLDLLAELLPDAEADDRDQAEDDDVLDGGESLVVPQQGPLHPLRLLLPLLDQHLPSLLREWAALAGSRHSEIVATAAAPKPRSPRSQ